MEDSRKTLQKLRASTRLRMLSNFRKIPKIEVNDIPKERTLFPGTKNDYWYEVDLGLSVDASACIYELAENSQFDAHYHEDRVEYLIPLTDNTKLEVITENYIKLLQESEIVFFKKKEKHAVVNHSPFAIKFLVIWMPKMKGLGLIFEKVKEEIKDDAI